jgi:hypothetical protein
MDIKLINIGFSIGFSSIIGADSGSAILNQPRSSKSSPQPVNVATSLTPPMVAAPRASSSLILVTLSYLPFSQKH